SMSEIWRHPLIRKYEKRYQGAVNYHIGPAPPIMPEDCGPPINSKEDVDIDLLRNLQTLWHDATPEAILKRILDPTPSHQRLFYNALVKFRNEHRRTRRAKGSSAKWSQFPPVRETGIRTKYNEEPKSCATVRSYDPFRSPQGKYPPREAKCAKITVYRNGLIVDVDKTVKEPSETAPQPRPTAKNDTDNEVPECPPSSPFVVMRDKRMKVNSVKSFHSKTSLSGSRRALYVASTPRSASYKRNVSFHHKRNRSQGSVSARARPPRPKVRNIRLDASESTVVSEFDDDPFSDAQESPSLPAQPTVVRGAGVTIRNCPQMKKVRNSDIIWKDDARKVSYELSQICEEAFNGSSLSTNCTASTCIGSETPATSVSIASPEVSHQQLASKGHSAIRTAPPAASSPRSYTAAELTETRRKLIQHSSRDDSGNIPGYLKPIIAHLDRLIEQDETKKQERRDHPQSYASAKSEQFVRPSSETPQPPEAQKNPDNAPERQSNAGYKAGDQGTALQSTPRKHPGRSNRDGKRTVRMVPHSSLQSMEPTRDLNIRKKRSSIPEDIPETLDLCTPEVENDQAAASTRKFASLNPGQSRGPCELDPIEETPGSPRRSGTRSSDNKKWSWFQNKHQLAGEHTTRDCSDIPQIQPSSATVIRHHQDDSRGAKARTQRESQSSGKASRTKPKGGFFRRLIHRRASKDAQNHDTGFDVTDTNVLLHHNPETANTTDTEYDGKPLPPPPRGGGKSQNWFARVFQLKPATRVIALNTSTTKARKYIHKTMREWKKWGMEDVYLDKDKRVIYGSVGEVNRRQENLSLVRFKQERGAASSFHKVVDTLYLLMKGQHMLMEDPARAKEMVRILDDYPNP
ncbi:uncharacterized protein An12g08530, partial [Aspergillus niger]|uniref:non-specific serine/threonine protein kinase n=2 Tax=Aspergillus niger TaxID=5061 RepID=A0AAJ8BS41_ASPNG